MGQEIIDQFQEWHISRYGEAYPYRVSPFFSGFFLECQDVFSSSTWEDFSETFRRFCDKNTWYIRRLGITLPMSNKTLRNLFVTLILNQTEHPDNASQVMLDLYKKYYVDFIDIGIDDILEGNFDWMSTYFIAQNSNVPLFAFDDFVAFHDMMANGSIFYLFLSEIKTSANRAAERVDRSSNSFDRYIECVENLWASIEPWNASIIRSMPRYHGRGWLTSVDRWASDYIGSLKSGLRPTKKAIRSILNLDKTAGESFSCMMYIIKNRPSDQLMEWNRSLADLNRALHALIRENEREEDLLPRRVIHPMESIFFGEDWIAEEDPRKKRR